MQNLNLPTTPFISTRLLLFLQDTHAHMSSLQNETLLLFFIYISITIYIQYYLILV